MTDITQGRGKTLDPPFFAWPCPAVRPGKYWSDLRGPNEARNLLEWHFLLAFGGGSRPVLRDTFGVARWHAMKLPRRKFLHLAAGAAALPVVSASRVRERRIIPPSRYGSSPTQHPAAHRMRCCASWATGCRRCGNARSSCSIIRVPGAPSQPMVTFEALETDWLAGAGGIRTLHQGICIPPASIF